MESFLNGRQNMAKVSVGQKQPESSSSHQPWATPEPGSALKKNKPVAEEHVISEGEHQPEVELVMVDGEVKKIQITCTCGQILHLDCHYKGAGK